MARSASFGSALPYNVPRTEKTGRRVVSNDLDAGDSLTSGPLPNGLQAFLSESRVAQSDCSPIRHLCIRAKKDRRSRVIATVG
jgi:hypothetical protein